MLSPTHAVKASLGACAVSQLLAQSGRVCGTSTAPASRGFDNEADEELSTPSEGTSSAPLSRRKLLSQSGTQADTKVRGATPRRPSAESRSGEGRLWRDRLASIKALLTVGTEAACREALDNLHKFITAVVESGTPVRHDSLAYDEKAPADAEPAFGEAEFRLCAQCVVLLLRVSSKEAILWRRLSPSGLLARALEQCAVCAAGPSLQQHMLASGITAMLVPVLSGNAKAASESIVLLLPALRTVCTLCTMFDVTQHDQLMGLVTALPPLVCEAPVCVAELAAQALSRLAQMDRSRLLLIDSGVLPCLVHACDEAVSRPSVAVEAARAIAGLAEDECNEGLIVQHGSVRAMLKILSQATIRAGSSGEGLSTAADAACESLVCLINSGAYRHALVDANGIQPLVDTVFGANEQQSKAAGWMLVSLAVDPSLGEAVVAQGAITGLVEHASSTDERCQEEAAWALANLSAVTANAKPMEDAGIPRFVLAMLRRSSDMKVKMQLLWTLANLAVQDPLKRVLGDEGVADELVRQLQTTLDLPSAEEEDEETVNNTLVQTTRALANLAVDATNRQSIAAADGLPLVLRALDVPIAKEVATRALVNLTFDSNIAQKLVEGEGIETLTSLLRCSTAPRVQHEAVRVALNISTRQGRALVTEATLESLVSLIESHGEALVREHAANVLCNLTRLDVENKIFFITTGALRRMSRLDLKDGSTSLQAACSDLMTALASVLTPSSRRALIGASLLPQDVHPGVRRASARRATQQRRPSPLAAATTVITSAKRPLDACPATQPIDQACDSGAFM